jgi:ethanolamine utilization protein EutN
MTGWRLLLVQPLGAQGQADGEPILAIDSLGAGVGSRVVLTSEGGAVRQLMGSKNSPVRWMVLGMCDL